VSDNDKTHKILECQIRDQKSFGQNFKLELISSLMTF